MSRNLPYVSVIMPIRNEARAIHRSLSTVLAQSYPKEKMEILIADGMSEDDTRENIAELLKKNGQFPVRVIDNPGRIVPTGFNLALREARGSVIVRVDGHTEIAQDYVAQCVKALERTGADNVGGRMIPQGEGPLAEAIGLATSTPFGVGGGRFHYSKKEEYVDTVYMGAWRRDVFDRVGVFDEELVRNQDDEFNYRLLKRGGRILLSPQIQSTYLNRKSLKSLWHQYFQYGYWKVRVLQKHPRQMQWRQFVPPLFVVGFIGSVLAAVIFPQSRSIACVMIGAYAIANLLASILTAARNGLRHLPLLLIVSSTLHLSYGSGFLLGLIKFAKRWKDS